MSTKELILDGGDTLDGNARKLRLNDTPDQTCVTVSTPAGIVAVLDRHQQHMLYLYLHDRLSAHRDVGISVNAQAPISKSLKPFIVELARQERVRNYRDGDCYLVDCRLTIGNLRRLCATTFTPADGGGK